MRHTFYYGIKPLVPARFRLAVRGWLARRKRQWHREVWPILPGSERPPDGWPGWPDGKKFALVLTHDVEGASGVAKCRQLMEVEKKWGFRSSFNFIPEGDYRVTKDLRDDLAREGFEVGVHDLQHDGKLYRSREGFAARAARINRYLQEWGAAGFRSGFMFHNLDWLHDLDIQYDASTFDTDPFEPQPDGTGTIFPFWHEGAAGRGYVEMPYTLPQDSTLYLLMGERTPAIWQQKADWVAEKGGMVLLNLHPDYVAFPGEAPNFRTFPVSIYEQFLKHICEKHGPSAWHCLPREVSLFVRHSSERGRILDAKETDPVSAAVKRGMRSRSRPRPKIWIDLDNTPHVPFFEPIIDELASRGFPLLITARDAFQVCELAEKKGLRFTKIGHHYGKNVLWKCFGLVYRSVQLAPTILKERPGLAVSHGARSQMLLSRGLGIPVVLIEDYEFCKFPMGMRPDWLLVPNVIPGQALTSIVKPDRLRGYPGLKEDVYAWKLNPQPGVLKDFGFDESNIIVTVRPPATEAHYHNPEGEKLFEAFMNRACNTRSVSVVLLPRNAKQGKFIRDKWPGWFESGKTVIPAVAVDGLDLIWHSDLVVSGGGTMNREAAALGVPVYSIFRGPIGAVDRSLAADGRMVLVTSVPEVESRITLARRARKSVAEITSRQTLNAIVDYIEGIAEAPGGE
jgi:predicted glycosyltransferase